HLHEREFRGKPVSRAAGAHEHGRVRRSNHAAHSTVSRTRAVLPDEGEMRLGRERPPKIRPRTVIGGWQRGSLTPQMPPSLLLTAAPTPIRAAKSAALATRANLLMVRDIATYDMRSRSRSLRV